MPRAEIPECKRCGQVPGVVGYDDHHRTPLLRCGCTAPVAAEIPEGVERFVQDSPPGVSYRMRSEPDGPWIKTADLPAIKAHWLEQLKEELGSRRDLEWLVELVERQIDGLSRAEAPVLGPRRVKLRNQLRDFLDSIPIEKGGDGDCDDLCTCGHERFHHDDGREMGVLTNCKAHGCGCQAFEFNPGGQR